MTTFFIGLAKGDFKIFEVTEGGPKLICEFDNSGVYKYTLVANASACTNASEPHYEKNCRMF